MSSFTWYPSGFAILDRNNQGINDHTSAVLRSNVYTGGDKAMLVKFDVPAALRGVKVTSQHYYANALSADGNRLSGSYIYAFPLATTFDPATATYANSSPRYFPFQQTSVAAAGWQELLLDTGALLDILKSVAAYGLYIDPESASIYTPASNGVKIELTYVSATHSVQTSSQTINPTVQNSLSWAIASDATLEPLAQTSAVVTYKLSGSSTEHTINVSNAAKSVVIPANTFPVGTSSYSVSVTLENGQVLTSTWTSIYVNAATICMAAPSSGYVANEVSTLFSWAVTRAIAGQTISVDVTGGSLQWRDGVGGTVTTVDVGVAKQYAMPANILPNSASIQWRIYQVTTAAGDSISTEWMTLTTLESSCSAATVEPKAVSVDGGKPITFKWSHIISTGTPPTGFEIQTSTDGSTYTQLVQNLDSVALQYTVAANTFTSGTLYWQVRTYNTDGTAGSWSPAASIVVIAAPTTPAIAVLDTSPRPTIRWTTSEQEGYELTLDGAVHTIFGSEQSWQSPEYLSDGTHIVSVRVINQYGLWSEPCTAVIPVMNSPGADIYLTADSGSTITLSWETSGYDFYMVYRDDVPIAKVTELSYVDTFSCGLTLYRVRGCYESGNNYGLSQELTANVRPMHLTIIDAVTGAVLELKYFDAQRGVGTLNRGQQASLIHVAGQAKPIAEISQWVDKTLSVSGVAVVDFATKRALEALLGRLVCLKTPDGDAATGPLTALNKVSNKFFSVYTIAVTDTAHEEAVSL